jgi:hypothetical protein
MIYFIENHGFDQKKAPQLQFDVFNSSQGIIYFDFETPYYKGGCNLTAKRC